MTIYPWQQRQWQMLLKQYLQNCLGHAFLFQGPKGLGKLDFAYFFSALLLCSHQGGEERCGRCRECILFEAGNHPDFYFLGPEEKSQSIKIDAVRDLIEFLGQTSQQGRGKVAIIHPAHTLSRSCSNALLKTLEEPRGQACIMLVADEPASLPPTVLSRCQGIVFQHPEEAQAIEWLQKQHSLPRNEALSLLQQSGYAPLLALSRIQNHYFSLREKIVGGLEQLLQKKVLLSVLASQWIQQDSVMALEIFFSLGLDLLRLKLGVAFERLENKDVILFLQRISEKVNLLLLNQWLSGLLTAISRLKTLNLNEALLMEGVLLQWQKLLLKKC